MIVGFGAFGAGVAVRQNGKCRARDLRPECARPACPRGYRSRRNRDRRAPGSQVHALFPAPRCGWDFSAARQSATKVSSLLAISRVSFSAAIGIAMGAVELGAEMIGQSRDRVGVIDIGIGVAGSDDDPGTTALAARRQRRGRNSLPSMSRNVGTLASNDRYGFPCRCPARCRRWTADGSFPRHAGVRAGSAVRPRAASLPIRPRLPPRSRAETR